jgi:hypothetical protein
LSGSQAAFRTTFTVTGGFLKLEQASRRGLPKELSEFVCNFIDACRNIIYFFSKIRWRKMEKTNRKQTKPTGTIFRTLKKWCCYKTVDFATAAPQNGVCITQKSVIK